VTSGLPEEAAYWSAGDAYERYVGRWSRLVAREFLDWLDCPSDARWLDVGCGTGNLTAAITSQCSPREVVGVDPSDGFLSHARSQVHDPRVQFKQGSAQDLPLGDGEFDVAIAGLVLNFVPDPSMGVGEMRRVVRPGGTVAAYVWDYAHGMEMMRRFWDAAASLDTVAAAMDESLRFAICQPEPLEALFREAGLQDVEVRAIDVPTVFRDFDDYWTPFLGTFAPAPAYVMSLDADRREALRQRLQETLPTEPDGSIRLTARAWALRGTRP
jgi:SAM-dependent methyltransferase